ncbi:MAG: hypothetical protein CSA81_10435 [Acidobacteria bacterium]|nr:MAG: hypothetical protein CSA81_10435 [Acidobacteriota bacterium]
MNNKAVVILFLVSVMGCSTVKNELESAYLNGDKEKVKKILSNKWKRSILINSKLTSGMTILELAAKNCDIEIIEFLVQKGAKFDLEEKGLLIVDFALNCPTSETLMFFLDRGLDPNDPRLLVSVIVEENLETLSLLVDRYDLALDTNIEHGSTLLHFAAALNNAQILEYLISNGAEINLRNNNGDTALHIACFGVAGKNDLELKKQIRAIQVLLNHNARISIRNNEGLTPEELARASNCNQKVISLFAE